MDIANVKHKKLRRFLETGDPRGVIEAGRVLDMVEFIDAAENLSELAVPPNFGFHALKGKRRGEFAMTATKNWRLTFTKIDETTIGNLDLEDYH